MDTGRVLRSRVSVAVIQVWSWLVELKEVKWMVTAERCPSFIPSGTGETANLPRMALDVFVLLHEALLRGIVCGRKQSQVQGVVRQSQVFWAISFVTMERFVR